MMSFKDAVITCVKTKAFTLQGRAQRSEYWWFILFYIIVGIVANIFIVIPIIGSIIYLVISLLLFIFPLRSVFAACMI